MGPISSATPEKPELKSIRAQLLVPLTGERVRCSHSRRRCRIIIRQQHSKRFLQHDDLAAVAHWQFLLCDSQADPCAPGHLNSKSRHALTSLPALCSITNGIPLAPVKHCTELLRFRRKRASNANPQCSHLALRSGVLNGQKNACPSLIYASRDDASRDGSGQTFEGVCKTRPPYREVLTR